MNTLPAVIIQYSQSLAVYARPQRLNDRANFVMRPYT